MQGKTFFLTFEKNGEMKRRRFKEGVPLHIYTKGRNSYGIFYTVEDFILYFTMYSVYSRKYNIRTLAFNPMINHTHEVCYTNSLKELSRFRQVLESKFAWEHNLARGRTGEVFKHNFGSAPKYVGKIIKSAIAYVNNNSVAGNLKSRALEYKWNGLAYFSSEHPFSEKIQLSSARRIFRQALKIIACNREQERWLGYALQNTIFKGLTSKEKLQIVDYIIVKYNFIDYEGTISYFGTWEKMITAIDSNSGSEHDIPEDWEDYSKYADMIKVLNRAGISIKCVNFDNMPLSDLANLYSLLAYETDAQQKQIMKFLHIRPFNYETDWMEGIPA